MLEALRALLKSKKFATSAIGLVLMIVVQIYPNLDAGQVDLFSQTILIFWGGIVGGFTIVEAAAASKTGMTKYDTNELKYRIQTQSLEQSAQSQHHDHEHHESEHHG